jgi:hypothetical protein
VWIPLYLLLVVIEGVNFWGDPYSEETAETGLFRLVLAGVTQ